MFSVYLPCNWKDAISYHTGSGFQRYRKYGTTFERYYRLEQNVVFWVTTTTTGGSNSGIIRRWAKRAQFGVDLDVDAFVDSRKVYLVHWCLIEELGLHSLPGNPTYNLTDFSASEVLDNHKSVLTSFGVQSKSEELDLPYIYWIPKMHKNPYKHRFIAGSSKCSTKSLSIILTKLLTHIKQGLQKYCETAYSRSGVNQMWILKNSKELLDHLKSPNFNLITNIKSSDFSTLYTTIPHQKLKSRLATIIRNSFLHKNGNRRYKYLVLGREGPYFVKEHSDAKNKYTEEDIIKMLEFLVDIFVVFAGKVFQQIVGIPMGTNCAPLLADIFLYSYEAEFIQSLLSAGKKRLASQFNFTYRYIDDVLSINNPDFENCLGQMYPPELEIKDTTESNTSASYLDLLLSIGRDGQLRTSLYDKRDDFNFHITNFPFLSSNIPSSPAYGVFISQLIRYARACSSYECFILRAMRLSNKLLGQGYVKERLKSSLRKFYGRYGDLTKQYEVPLSRMLHDILDDDHIQWHPPLIGHYTNFWPLLIWTLLPNLTFYLIVQGFHRTYICNGCGMPTEDAYSSGHLVLSHFGTCMCSNVETNFSWTCLVSGLLNFEHPSVLLFCLKPHATIFQSYMWRHRCADWRSCTYGRAPNAIDF